MDRHAVEVDSQMDCEVDQVATVYTFVDDIAWDQEEAVVEHYQTCPSFPTDYVHQMERKVDTNLEDNRNTYHCDFV